MLSVEQRLPVKRICEMVEALTGQKFNPATVQRILKEGHDRLETETQAIQAKILKQPDETGICTAGKLHWTHVLSNKQYTYFFVHTARDLEALESADRITHKFGGILVSDSWRTYFKLNKLNRHAICAAHLIRELRAISKRSPEKEWVEKLSTVLLYLCCYSVQGSVTVEQAVFKRVSRHHDHLIEQGLARKPAPQKGKRGRPRYTKATHLLIRLRDYKTEVFRFATDIEIPFTNNLAEHDIHPTFPT